MAVIPWTAKTLYAEICSSFHSHTKCKIIRIKQWARDQTIQLKCVLVKSFHTKMDIFAWTNIFAPKSNFSRTLKNYTIGYKEESHLNDMLLKMNSLFLSLNEIVYDKICRHICSDSPVGLCLCLLEMPSIYWGSKSELPKWNLQRKKHWFQKEDCANNT